ncbi:MAG: hypothetical protein HY700_17335 [Gemmatimonadetes bacterium]|nr:hypothetical protein [Gemmatimonadota bacterium]
MKKPTLHGFKTDPSGPKKLKGGKAAPPPSPQVGPTIQTAYPQGREVQAAETGIRRLRP